MRRNLDEGRARKSRQETASASFTTTLRGNEGTDGNVADGAHGFAETTAGTC